ncbi:MAG: aminotransferase class I/II-fold pyridoxal phosphate-dependent enzyme [Candidatus Marinimicrobia bacterium]|nr:aminotransferase class I/II-fold pyridoxal phosphate-dependent enzyme [Candidatus Neomarinimicrobiota bacterium]
MKYSFRYDYSEGAHPRILERLRETNNIQQSGYGEDQYCDNARNIIRQLIGNPDAHVHFVSGGTQANLTMISAILKPYESVIAAETGHIFVHETGAIEATGHKINTIPTRDGKITINGIQKVLDEHTDEHMVLPKLVFISNSTEIGTVYNKAELTLLSNFCREKDLLLYLDGARLGSAIMSADNDMTLKELSSLLDSFYIGGTKNGALLGEAIVINNPKIQEKFRFHMKMRGALLAKGRIFGLMFEELLKDGLYFNIARQANQLADKIRIALAESGYSFFTQTTSNQIFPILPNSVIEKLSKDYEFYIWRKIDDQNSAIRLVTSWAMEEDAINQFINDLKKAR